MPYPFAHPAAILPLARPMGRFAVPSALAIGAIAPDLWYLVPPLARAHSHSLIGLLAFCLPAGIVAYLAFHLLLKQPLLALLPRSIACRLAGVTAERLPRVPWTAVLASLLAGAATHVLWDAATHDRFVVHDMQVLQHVSTLLGTAMLAAWLWRWLRDAAPQDLPPRCVLPPLARGCIVGLLIGLTAGWTWRIAGLEAIGLPQDLEEWRYAMRTAGLAGVQALALSSIGYAVLWKVLR